MTFPIHNCKAGEDSIKASSILPTYAYVISQSMALPKATILAPRYDTALFWQAFLGHPLCWPYLAAILGKIYPYIPIPYTLPAPLDQALNLQFCSCEAFLLPGVKRAAKKVGLPKPVLLKSRYLHTLCVHLSRAWP